MSQYIHTPEIHNLSAPQEIVPIVIGMTKPTSVLDVGCGTGTWLNVFASHGIADYIGVDSPDVPVYKLHIPVQKFTGADLRKPLKLDRHFDLVLSLEVAEHLPPDCADAHIESLIRHGNVILFSAAIPGQGGQNHLNEQWPSWWQEKFRRHGFYFHDVIRPLIWDNEKVDYWYRQNIFLVNRQKEGAVENIMNVVHPRLLEEISKANGRYVSEVIRGRQGVMIGLRIMAASVVYKLKSLLGAGDKNKHK